MRKLTLNLDDLTVTSFDTDAAPERAGGTVYGRMPHKPVEETEDCPVSLDSCNVSACPDPFNTCGYSCDCVTTTANAVFCH